MPERAGTGDLLLLDTQVWIWAVNDIPENVAAFVPELLTDAAEDGRVRVSAVSVWEAALAISRERVPINGTRDAWLDRGVASFGGRTVALDAHIALDSVRLPGLQHRDPADRFLIATARTRGARLVTTDRVILAYGAAGHVRVIDARP